jgi:hypothetical protein
MFVAIGVQPAMHMRHNVICELYGSTIFSILFHKRHDFRKKITEHKIRVLILSTTYVWNISHPKKNWTRYDEKMYIGLHVQCPLFGSDFNETLILSTDFRKIFRHQISCKSVHWEHADGRTYSYDKANSRCSQFCERAYKQVMKQNTQATAGDISYIIEV